MILQSETTPTAPQDAPAAPATAAQPEVDRIAYLFRAWLNAGRIHPLYLPMLKYRQSRS